MENNLDNFFKRKLEKEEPEFTPAAWERMEHLLDEEGLVPKEKKPRRVGFIIPIFLIGLLVICIGYLQLTWDSNREGSTLSQNKSDLEVSDLLLNNKPITEPIEKTANENSTDRDIESKQFLASDSDVELVDLKIAKQKTVEIEYQNAGPQSHDMHLSGKSKRSINDNHNSTGNTSAFELSKIAVDEFNADDENAIQNETTIEGIEVETTKVASLSSKGLTEDNKDDELKFSPFDQDGGKDKVEHRTDIRNLEFLTSELSMLQMPVVQLTPQIQIIPSGFFNAGIQVLTRYNNGLGYSIGPYGSLRIGSGYSIVLGVQLDVQKYGNGPLLRVTDKQYSFGSTITDREFQLNNQKMIRFGVSIDKQFRGYRLSSGFVLYKPLVISGNISGASDIEVLESQNIENDLIKPFLFGVEAGVAISLTRFLEVYSGIEIRSGAFRADEHVSDSKTSLYPTVGLRYKLIKL